MSDRIVRVAAAVILRGDGQVLLAQRPVGKVYAGFWEFPGGKLEAGESPHAALVRELHEELGLTIRRATPWLLQRYVYPHAHVELHFFRVWAWDGEPVGHDGQAFAWQTPGHFDVGPLLPANTRVLSALLLPTLLSAADLACDCVCWSTGQLRMATARPAVNVCAAWCRSRSDLARAGELGLDFAVLGPVTCNPDDPDASPLGWDGLAAAVDGTTIPVFATGGLDRDDLEAAIDHGAHGVVIDPAQRS